MRFTHQRVMGRRTAGLVGEALPAVNPAGKAAAPVFPGRCHDVVFPDAEPLLPGFLLEAGQDAVAVVFVADPRHARGNLVAGGIDAVAVDNGDGLFLPVGVKDLVLGIFAGAEAGEGAAGMVGAGLARFGRINIGEPDFDGLRAIDDGEGIAAGDGGNGRRHGGGSGEKGGKADGKSVFHGFGWAIGPAFDYSCGGQAVIGRIRAVLGGCSAVCGSGGAGRERPLNDFIVTHGLKCDLNIIKIGTGLSKCFLRML